MDDVISKRESTIYNLENLTSIFFKKHWNQEIIKSAIPYWSKRYEFKGGNLANYNKQGVYAFVKEEIVTYIGVATSKGHLQYRGHGLSKRLQSYTKVVNDIHTPTDSRLIDAGAMITIGFDVEYAYLANALELFLIGRLDTIHNNNRPGS